MMIHAYDPLYLAKASRTLGNMLHVAVVVCGIPGESFLQFFVQSGIALEFERGNPKYIAGKSGLELFLEIMEKITGRYYDLESVKTYEKSPEYWVGWVIAHYQWYSGRTYKSILSTISYDNFLGLYATLHEADIEKCYDVFDEHFRRSKSNLQIARNCCGITQETLAKESGVSVYSIRAYEQKSKNINKAQFETVVRLAKVLHCNATDLLE